MKKASFMTLLSFWIIAGHTQDIPVDYSEAFHLIEVWLEAQKDFEQLPGISAAVIDDQDIIWSGGFGTASMKDNVKTEASTLYSICSISKLFTSIAIMKLYNEGKLRLEDRIDDLLPWYDLKQAFNESWPITIRSLLSHSSGLPRESDFPYWSGPDFYFPSRIEMREALVEQETMYPSSTHFQYSNLGMTLLGEVVEEVSGMSYDEYIRQNILAPLGLEDTRTELPESLHGDRFAVGYSAINRNGERERVSLFQAKGIKAAAGYSSNVIDLGKLASWQFRLIDSTEAEILEPSTLKYMYNVHWTDPDWNNTWGLGFKVYRGPGGKKMVGHGGSCPGYRTQLQLDVENKRAIVVMINANGVNPSKYINGIGAILKKAEAGSRKEEPENEGEIVDLEEYSGFYSNFPWGAEIYLFPWKGRLGSMNLPRDSPGSFTTFEHVKDDVFQRTGKGDRPGDKIFFERNSEGEIVRFRRQFNYKEKIDRQ